MRTRAREDRSPVILWYAVVTTTIVTIGTLVPFSFNRPLTGMGDWLARSLVRWPVSPPTDIVANIVVYLPIGALFTLLITRRTPSRLAAITLALMLGAIMSITLEWLQTMSSARVASWMDVCMNTLGTLLGALCGILLTVMAPAGRRFFKSLAVHPVSTAAGTLTVGLVLYHLLPFDFVSSNAALHRSLGQTILWPWMAMPPATTDSTMEWIHWAGYAGQFALLGLLSALAYREQGLGSGQSLSRLLARVALVPFAIEVSQVFVVSHAFDTRDWLAAVAGGLLGLAVSREKRIQSRFPASSAPGFVAAGTKRLWTPLLLMVLLGQIAYLLASSAAPFDLSWDHVELSRFMRWPFSAACSRPFGSALANLTGTAVTFGLMALLVRALVGALRHRTRILTVILLVLSIALICEFLKLLTATRHPDPTEPLIALCVALPIATRRHALSSPPSLG